MVDAPDVGNAYKNTFGNTTNFKFDHIKIY